MMDLSLRFSSKVFSYIDSVEKGGCLARSLHVYTAVIIVGVSRFMG
jgi:hypothetical protein